MSDRLFPIEALTSVPKLAREGVIRRQDHLQPRLAWLGSFPVLGWETRDTRGPAKEARERRGTGRGRGLARFSPPSKRDP